VSDEPTPRGGIEGFPTGLSWLQHHRVARVVASAATDAEDCALLLAALGVHPADGRALLSLDSGRGGGGGEVVGGVELEGGRQQ
jgi:hypothetical protein